VGTTIRCFSVDVPGLVSKYEFQSVAESHPIDVVARRGKRSLCRSGQQDIPGTVKTLSAAVSVLRRCSTSRLPAGSFGVQPISDRVIVEHRSGGAGSAQAASTDSILRNWHIRIMKCTRR
jgi:hypothetical protein